MTSTTSTVSEEKKTGVAHTIVSKMRAICAESKPVKWDSIVDLFPHRAEEVHHSVDGSPVWGEIPESPDITSMLIEYWDPEIEDWSAAAKTLMGKYPKLDSFAVAQWSGYFLHDIPKFIQAVKPRVFVINVSDGKFTDAIVDSIAKTQTTGGATGGATEYVYVLSDRYGDYIIDNGKVTFRPVEQMWPALSAEASDRTSQALLKLLEHGPQDLMLM